MIEKMSYHEKEMMKEQVFPELLGKDKSITLKRFITAKDLSYRAGYARMEKGSSYETFHWYDQFWCVLEGEGKIKAVDRVSGEEKELRLKPKDVFFVSKGVWMKPVALSEEPFVFFYCALPAGSKDAAWLAYMTPEDINDIKKRGEH